VARGLAQDDGEPGLSGYSVLVSEGLILLAVTLMIFHFGNAPGLLLRTFRSSSARHFARQR